MSLALQKGDRRRADLLAPFKNDSILLNQPWRSSMMIGNFQQFNLGPLHSISLYFLSPSICSSIFTLYCLSISVSPSLPLCTFS